MTQILKATRGGPIDIQAYTKQRLEKIEQQLVDEIKKIDNIGNRHTVEKIVDDKRQYVSVGRLCQFTAIARQLSNVTSKVYSKLTVNEIKEWLKNRPHPLSPRTFNMYLVILKMVIDEEIIKQIEQMKVKERSLKDSDVLTQQERLDIIKSCQTKRDMAMLTILMNVGCRRNELLRISKKDIHYDNPTEREDMYVVVQNSKLSEHKESEYEGEIEFGQIYIEDYLGMPEIKSLPDNALLFPMTDNNVYMILQKAAKAAKITKPFSAHKWRHARVTETKDVYQGIDRDRRYGWTPGSAVSRVYDHNTSHGARLKAKSMRKGEPLPQQTRPSDRCPKCNHTIGPGDTSCPRCYKVINPVAEKERLEAHIRERRIMEELTELRKGYDKVMEFLEAQKKEEQVDEIIKQRQKEQKDITAFI